MTTNLLDLSEQFRRLVDTNKAVTARTGLLPSEALALYVLWVEHDHRIRIGELAEVVGMSPSGATRLFQRLARRGYLAKGHSASHDMRLRYVTLTPEGLAKAAQLNDEMNHER